jgi:hypothetical protein
VKRQSKRIDTRHHIGMMVACGFGPRQSTREQENDLPHGAANAFNSVRREIHRTLLYRSV